MIRFSCPGCGRIFERPDADAGRAATCKCGQRMEIPAPDPAPPAAAPVEPGYDREYAPSPRSRLPVVVILTLLSVGIVVAACVIVWKANNPTVVTLGPDGKPVEEAGGDPKPDRRPAVNEPPEPSGNRRGDDPSGAVIDLRSLIIAILVGLLILHIYLMAWIVKDARRRSVENGVIWMLGALWFGLVVWIIYLWSRPPGNLVPCHRCRQPRLPYVRVCPTCGHLTEE